MQPWMRHGLSFDFNHYRWSEKCCEGLQTFSAFKSAAAVLSLPLQVSVCYSQLTGNCSSTHSTSSKSSTLVTYQLPLSKTVSCLCDGVKCTGKMCFFMKKIKDAVIIHRNHHANSTGIHNRNILHMSKLSQFTVLKSLCSFGAEIY